MIPNELHFTNPISLIVANSILGKDLKRAKFVQFIENERYLNDSKRDNNMITLVSSQVAESLGIDFDVIKLEDHLANPAKIIESNMKRDFFPSGQTLIMIESDIYCRFGFRNYINFPYSKYRLKNAWRVVKFPIEDSLYGYSIKSYNKNVRNNYNTFDLNIQMLKNIVGELNEKVDFDFTKFYNGSAGKKYLLIMPYRHDRINEEFSKNFFLSVENIARRMNLGVIVKNHPNDVFDYSHYFSEKSDIFFHLSLSERHIPVEFLLQSKQVLHTISVPSSSLAFAEKDRLSVLVAANRSLYRKKFLDQEPFLNRLKLNVETI